MNDVEYIRQMDRVITASREPRQGKYPYQMKVVVTQEWLMDIMADDQDEAFYEANLMIKTADWQANAELEDETIEATNAYEQ